MIFPIGDDNVQGGHKPLVAYIFIVVNIIVFLYQSQLPQGQLNAFFMEYGVVPRELFAGEDRYTLLTNMFLHGGWMHLIGNMLFLWVFADNIEAVIGRLPFFAFYVIGGVIASLIHAGFESTSNIPAVGASGAISAVMGAYLVMFPKSRIKMIFIAFFRTFYISALYFLGFWIVQQLISGMSAFGQPEGQTGVAWWAHIGGFAFGVVVGYFLKRFHPYEYGQSGYSAPDPVI
jgi:membrane associated rhomboid family serine protease